MLIYFLVGGLHLLNKQKFLKQISGKCYSFSVFPNRYIFIILDPPYAKKVFESISVFGIL